MSQGSQKTLVEVVRDSTQSFYKKTINHFKKEVSDTNDKVAEDLGRSLAEQYQGVTTTVSNHVKANIKGSKVVTNHFIRSATEDYDFPLKATGLSCLCALIGLGFVVSNMINNKSLVNSRQSDLEQIASDFENQRCYQTSIKDTNFRIGYMIDSRASGVYATECFYTLTSNGSIREFARIVYKNDRLYVENVFSGAEITRVLEKRKSQK